MLRSVKYTQSADRTVSILLDLISAAQSYKTEWQDWHKHNLLQSGPSRYTAREYQSAQALTSVLCIKQQYYVSAKMPRLHKQSAILQ